MFDRWIPPSLIALRFKHAEGAMRAAGRGKPAPGRSFSVGELLGAGESRRPRDRASGPPRELRFCFGEPLRCADVVPWADDGDGEQGTAFGEESAERIGELVFAAR